MTRLVRLCAVIVTILLTSAAIAQDRPSLNLREFTLGNGLEVILIEDRSAPTVAVNITYDVGSVDDPIGRSGFAHLFEHLMFEETAHLATGELDRLVESVGGYLNAYTDAERTVYYTILPAHQLPLALWYEADRMASLSVTGANFNNQRAIVIEEYNQTSYNAPYGEAFEYLITLPFTVPVYRQRVIGSVPDLNAAGAQEAVDFHARHYLPNNATLVVAGDIDFGQAESMVRGYFDPIPAGAEPPTPDYTRGESQASRYDFLDPLANVPAYLVGYPIPARTERDYAAIEVVARLLTQGSASRLAGALRDTGYAGDLGAFIYGNRHESLFAFYALANAGVPLSEIESVYQRELQRLIDEGIAPGELTKAINALRAEAILAVETVEGLAETAQSGQFYYSDPNGVLNEIDRFAQVTADDVRRVAATYLTPASAVVLLVEPTTVGATTDLTAEQAPVAIGSAADAAVSSLPRAILSQATPPAALAVRPFTLPPISEARLDNGLTVITISRPDMPIALLTLTLPGGASADPAAQAGLAELAAAVVTRGTTTRSAQAIANAIESVGGSIGANIDDDALSIGAFTLRADAALAFELLADVAINPTFPDNEVDIARQTMITALDNLLSDGASLAERTFLRLVYGGHPYGVAPTQTTLAGLTADMARFYYTSQAQPDRAFLIVAGALSHDESVNLARQYFGGWVGIGGSAPAALPVAITPTAPGIYLVDRPGSVQADFLIGALGITATDPNRDSLKVMNAVLGGTFSARLGRLIREELGYTYGIYSGVSLPVSAGTISIATAVGADVAAPALREILNQVALLRDQPVPADELAAVLNGLSGGEALSFETVESVVTAVAEQRLSGLPTSELRDALERVRTIDAAAVAAAAGTYLSANRLVIVVVGDAAVLEPALSAVAPVTRLEAQ
ncbi:MAG: pitrilysin family protein [Chloroflexota bacterium]|nr:pitrilysin family protein [Chloroflexota bacterium]